jgi:hypothetical protein
VAWIGNSSLAFERVIIVKGGNEALVTGEIVWVNTNQKIHRSVPVSKPISRADRGAGEASGLTRSRKTGIHAVSSTIPARAAAYDQTWDRFQS